MMSAGLTVLVTVVVLGGIVLLALAIGHALKRLDEYDDD